LSAARIQSDRTNSLKNLSSHFQMKRLALFLNANEYERRADSEFFSDVKNQESFLRGMEFAGPPEQPATHFEAEGKNGLL
jgi:predicted HD phosphohydrolase